MPIKLYNGSTLVGTLNNGGTAKYGSTSLKEIKFKTGPAATAVTVWKKYTPITLLAASGYANWKYRATLADYNSPGYALPPQWGGGVQIAFGATDGVSTRLELSTLGLYDLTDASEISFTASAASNLDSSLYGYVGIIPESVTSDFDYSHSNSSWAQAQKAFTAKGSFTTSVVNYSGKFYVIAGMCGSHWGSFSISDMVIS